MRKRSYKIQLIISCLGLSSLLLFSYLTFIPKQTFAATMLDPTEMRTLSSIEYMQNMTQQICINSRENETKQLKDSRDDKLYWVTKLKDGNCWMTQNLDYNIPSTIPAATSDVTEDVQIGDTRVEDFTRWEQTTTNGKYKGYYDPGVLYYTRANGVSDSVPCGVGFTTTSDGINHYVAVGSGTGDALMEACKAIISKNGDDHYQLGNYYSYNAATAGSGEVVASTSNTYASMSICPKGWKLPTSDPASNSVNGSFANLLRLYSTDNIANSNIYADPLYFVYGGNMNHMGLAWVGTHGAYWSSTISGGNTSYVLVLDTTTLLPFNAGLRYLGAPIRCLAMGGWLDSYPDPNDQSSVAITVAPVITLEVTKDATNEGGNIDFTEVAVDTIEVRVGSNLGYKVLISTPEDKVNLLKQPDNTNQPSTNTNTNTTEGILSTGDTSSTSGTSGTSNASDVPFIPMITKDTTILPRTKAWGIKKLGTNANDIEVSKDTIYSPVGIGDKAEVFYTSETAASTTLVFPVAIAVDSTTPFGTYSTQVTLTAVVN